MAGIQSSAGAKLYIGTTIPATTAAAFLADTWVQVGQVESLGEFGDGFTPVQFTGLSDARVQKYKGSADAGSVSASYALEVSDAGQVKMVLAHADILANYNFKVVFSGAEIRYFKGQVLSLKEALPNANAILMVSAEIGINSPIIKV